MGKLLIMDESGPPSLPSSDSLSMLKLARELEFMRDSLVELSLTLQDYQLQRNGHERVETICVLEKLLSRIRHSH